uniref:Cyclic nucleotide-binding domain-containing protein n=1 Tax=Steinernema glaseri TaxID=37863 RepID=A0A1I7YZQ2_9BILA
MGYPSSITESTLSNNTVQDQAAAHGPAVAFNFVFFAAFALVAGSILNETNKRIRFLRIPDSVLLFLSAFVASLVIEWCIPDEHVKVVKENLTWNNISPQMIQSVLLPPMLFESAFKINAYMFWSKFELVLSVTVFLYFATVITTAAYLMPLFCVLEKWWISLPFLLCSILVATDPVAVVALLDEIGAPKRMKILIEGESLLNDGLAIFVFRFCCELLLVFLLIAVYFVFHIGEKTHGSAALAVMFFGLTMSYYKENLRPTTFEKILHDWENYGYWANCIIFMMAGYFVGDRINHGYDIFWMLAGVFLSVTPLVARMFCVFVFFQMWNIAFPQVKLHAPDFVLLSYGGLRGALAILLAMELDDLAVKDVLGEVVIDKLIILCCASVFACLVIQGMTFVFLAVKEGTSKRSKYLKTTEKRLHLYLRRAVGNGIRSMRRDAGVYLREANWNVVKGQIQDDIFSTIDSAVETSASSREMSRLMSTDYDTQSTLSRRAASDITKSDVRSGYYGILLGKVHDEWVRGAISGPTAHVIIIILEHGIDEGRIKSNDFRDQLKVVQASRILYLMQSLLGAMVKKLLASRVAVHLSTVGTEHFAANVESEVDTKLQAKRSAEWWWLLSTVLSVSHTVVTIVALYTELQKPDTQSYFITVYILSSFLFVFVLFLENLIRLHRIREVRRSESHHATPRKASCIPKLAKSTVELVMCVLLMVLTVGELILILCLAGRFSSEGHMCLYTDDHAKWKWREDGFCEAGKAMLTALTGLVTIYKLLRGVPLLILSLHEVIAYWIIRQDRIRLSVLHFFQHLTSDTKIYQDLFTDDTYKAAILEQRSLNKIVEGLIRYEMKRNQHMMDVIAVIKTRQAIRMASHTLNRTLKDLRKEGFLPEENFASWSRHVLKLRQKADRVVSVSRAHITEQLQNVRWIQMLEERERRKVIRFLSEHIEAVKCHTVPDAFLVHTRGSAMYFIQKGVCKLTERTQTRGGLQCHEMYIYQGDFIGEFNIVTIDGPWKALRKKIPKKVKMQYRTITECELVRIDISVLLCLRRFHVVETILRIEQLRRLKNELKELKRSTSVRMLSDDEFAVFFANNGRKVRAELTLDISDNKLVLLGCAVRVVEVVPAIKMNGRGHVEGPAKLTVAPIDKNLEAMILIIDWSGAEFPLSEGGDSNISIDITDQKKT